MVDVTFWLMTLFAVIGVVTSLVLHRRSEDWRRRAMEQERKYSSENSKLANAERQIEILEERLDDLEPYVSELKTYQYAVVDIVEDLHGKETNVLKQETVDKIMETEEGKMLAAGEEIASEVE